MAEQERIIQLGWQGKDERGFTLFVPVIDAQDLDEYSPDNTETGEVYELLADALKTIRDGGALETEK